MNRAKGKQLWRGLTDLVRWWWRRPLIKQGVMMVAGVDQQRENEITVERGDQQGEMTVEGVDQLG